MVNFMAKQDESQAALSHLSQTCQLVNQKLSSPQALSDITVAVVVCICIYEQLRGDTQKRRLHMDGLRRMIELRGGIGELQQNNALLQKICRSDITLALHEGSPTRFFWDGMPRLAIDSALGNAKTRTEDLPKAFRDFPSGLSQLIVDVTDLSHLLNRSPAGPRLEPYAFQATMISLFNRLIQFRFLKSQPATDAMEDAVHLGLMAFMTTLLLFFGRRQQLPYELLSKRLITSLQKIRDSCPDELPVALWLLIVGSISVFDQVGKAWSAEEIKTIARDMAVESWDSLRGAIGRFPWIRALHDQRARIFWESTVGSDS